MIPGESQSEAQQYYQLPLSTMVHCSHNLSKVIVAKVPSYYMSFSVILTQPIIGAMMLGPNWETLNIIYSKIIPRSMH